MGCRQDGLKLCIDMLHYHIVVFLSFQDKRMTRDVFFCTLLSTVMYAHYHGCKTKIKFHLNFLCEGSSSYGQEQGTFSQERGMFSCTHKCKLSWLTLDLLGELAQEWLTGERNVSMPLQPCGCPEPGCWQTISLITSIRISRSFGISALSRIVDWPDLF